MTRNYDHDGLGTIIRGFTEMYVEAGGIEEMGYREAEAAYMALLALDWFKNMGEARCSQIGDLQDHYADRVDGDPHEDVVILNPDYE